jgi:broad specificity phosphatase PhoE
LTDKGIDQARNLREQIVGINPAAVIMSPLTRSMRTGLEVCAHLTCVEYHITPLLREHTYSTCDMGLNASELSNAWAMWEMKLHALPNEWWTPSKSMKEKFHDSSRNCRELWQDLQDRVEELVTFLHERVSSGETILVVGHAVLFFALTGKWMKNCEIQEFNLESKRDRCNCSGHVCCC